MLWMILGLLLWVGAHWFKRLLPRQRGRMGDKGRGLVALLVVAGLAMIIIGYRRAEYIHVWSPPDFMVHINNLLMLMAFWVYGSSAAKAAKAWPAYKVRHPQLLAVKIWALAHLLVNGDLASVILFGTLLLWAGLSVMLINRAEIFWTPPTPAGRATYIRLAGISAILFAVVAGIHIWLGVSPFPA